LSLFAGDAQPDQNANLQEFWRVWELLDEKFATASGTDPLSPEQKVQGAIDGLVAAYGDPYTTYFPPKEADAFNEDISGNFSGVGMEVGMRNNILTIISPLSGTPAEKAGLLAGDAILKINGTSTERMGVDEAVRLIRGEEGTVVVLSIYREGDREPREISVTRAKIEIPTVKTEIRDGVYVLTLYSFNALAEKKFEDALRDYSRSNATKLVVDLRGNPGGYLQSAVSIASYFMPAGKVVLRENFGDERAEEIYRSYGRTIKDFSPKEIVVLIDGGSASASEILAGALQEQGYATLLGQPSFGKGSVQELVPLPGGSSLKVTIARWLTPNGTSISNGGLTPDIVVPRTVEDREANRDPQLEAAIAVAKGTYIAPVATTTPSTNN
ncbi:MAG: carboxy-terminal-processing protease, carboxyl-terminal processing protease, partial [Candidatus Parcubacteria bacterium]